MAQRRETSRHRDAFEAWYAVGRSFRKISQNLAVKERTLYDWAQWFNWHDLADKRDEEAQRLADAEAAKERAQRQKRRRQAGELMTARGHEFFQKNTIESAPDATRAIKYGTEIERKEDGIPDWVLLILNADPNELEKLARDFANSAAGSEAAGGGDDRLSLEAGAEDE